VTTLEPVMLHAPEIAADVPHVQLLLDSFGRLLGRELVPREGSAEEQARRLFTAAFVVVSHGVEADPLLTYGNRAALDLWEMTAAEFRGTPSRLTAEPVHRDERARLLERTRRDGFVDDYRGIRISRTGRRFLIERAIVWNLTDTDGTLRGQAATFAEWTPLAG
jgi:MEKHLA domain